MSDKTLAIETSVYKNSPDTDIAAILNNPLRLSFTCDKCKKYNKVTERRENYVCDNCGSSHSCEVCKRTTNNLDKNVKMYECANCKIEYYTKHFACYGYDFCSISCRDKIIIPMREEEQKIEEARVGKSTFRKPDYGGAY